MGHRMRIAAVALALGGLVLSSCANADTAPTTTLGGREVIYVRALSEVKTYLADWHRSGPSSASNEYLVSSQQGGKVKLLRGRVTSYHPYSWTSQNKFTLLVGLDLHFSGWPGAWNIGDNDRYVTFIWSKVKHHYLLEFSTGP